jgi:hypothetical protein
MDRGGADWQDDEASKVSGEGASYQAMVDGFSETGSDADISESCQVLLGLEAHVGNRTVTNGSKKESAYSEVEMAGNLSYNLGKVLGVTEDLVNYDGDKGDCALVESAFIEPRVEGVQTCVADGAHTDVGLVYEGSKDREAGQDPGSGEFGPAHVITNSFCDLVSKEGCDKSYNHKCGPKLLRTRKGDLLVDGPPNTLSSCEAQTAVKKKKTLAEKHSTFRKNSNKIIPNLPCNKFQKFAAVLQPKNRPGRRKRTEKQIQTNSTRDDQSDSDSIHNSEDTNLLQPLLPQQQTGDCADFQLEVVLTGQLMAVENVVNENLEHMANRKGSGLATLLCPAEDVAQSGRVHEEEAMNRQVLEANRIMGLQQEVGITIQESKEEHLNRIGVMEVRDKAEKDGWELNRVPASSQ